MLVLLCLAWVPAVAQQSVFEKSTECWTLIGDANGPYLIASGGTSGGYAQAVDRNDRQTWYWNAPAKFLKNKRSAIGKYIRFDIKTTHPGSSRLLRNVLIDGNGISIGATMPNLPQTSWTHNDILLTPANWHHISNDATVSLADFEAIMSNITKIWILGEYSPELDRGGLDNFTIETQSDFAQFGLSPCNSLCYRFLDSTNINTTSWQWAFENGNPATSSDQNPANICFPGAGTYTVRLIACNGTCACDTITKQIRVGKTETTQNEAICKGSLFLLPGGRVVNTAGTYIDTLVSALGCDSIITTRLLVKDNPRDSVFYSICEGTAVQAVDTTISSPGSFVRKLKTKEGCDSTVFVEVAVQPIQRISHSFTICKGNEVADGDTAFKTEGSFVRHLVSKRTGCDSVHTTHVRVVDMEVKTNPDTLVAVGATVPLHAVANRDSVAFSWSPLEAVECATCSETESTVWRNTRFEVAATDTAHGCQAVARLLVRVRCPINIPNLVTLNGDSTNDFFYLKNQRCIRKINQVEVYNRWGNLVFKKSAFSEGYSLDVWTPTMPGVYFYRLLIDFYEGESQWFNDWIEVLR